MPTALAKTKISFPIIKNTLIASFMKMFNFRYLQDIGYFINNKLIRKI